VSNVNAYWVNDKPRVGDDGSFKTCPCQDETHTLRAVKRDGSEQTLYVTIRVSGQCPTPTPPPPPPEDKIGPDISALETHESSLDNSCSQCALPCETDVYVNVDDPSGVAGVKLVYRKPGETTWNNAGMTNAGGTTYKTTLNANGWNAGTIEFYVRAYDNRGNDSESGHLTIEVEYCLY